MKSNDKIRNEKGEISCQRVKTKLAYVFTTSAADIRQSQMRNQKSERRIFSLLSKAFLFFALYTLISTPLYAALATEKMPADTNSDGVITTADAQLIYSYILDTVDNVSLEQVDVNGDGKVNTADVVAVYVEMNKGITGTAPDSDDTEFGY